MELYDKGSKVPHTKYVISFYVKNKNKNHTFMSHESEIKWWDFGFAISNFAIKVGLIIQIGYYKCFLN